MDALRHLQEWYAAQCDGDWEHSFGITIGTLDNPGWRVTIDLDDTALVNEPFDAVERGDHENDKDWMVCRKTGTKFEGAGGARNLNEILEVFLAWARSAASE